MPLVEIMVNSPGAKYPTMWASPDQDAPAYRGVAMLNFAITEFSELCEAPILSVTLRSQFASVERHP
jgi:hypothetical protein